ncbi:BRCA1 C Terminus domain containing protein [Coccidioides posadasii C735 delta SOWgp]|uniref:Replication factor C subunit 1 n=1 Tax=Coccidioides posadasii (strain C735) TaxID=222929 RepID=C5PBR9_COCP7|nr:BRCA1 C Terminus domain containing protein [Coccidioides posadasii C735 delta SOWgp]EER25396.1 BRCA1 C Terminus domain containing protein [Coccidioides posadasii C735 delta SOWgp]|eukprot:XP_003067541.1 BRCA1 C Terminus domain containing protein [Coccidioides posadasii C735 delta SOWgp]
MAPDIRSFFGTQSSQGSKSGKGASSKKPEDNSKSKKRRGRKVIEDSEDEDVQPVKTTPKPEPKKKRQKPEETEEPTTTSDYFASSRKSRRGPKSSAPVEESKPKKSEISEAKSVDVTSKSRKSDAKRDRERSPAVVVRNGRTRQKPKATKILDADDSLGGDDIFATEYQKRGGGGGDDDYQEEEDEDSDFEELQVESRLLQPAPKVSRSTNTSTRNGQKRKSDALHDEDEESELSDKQKKKAARGQAVKSPTKPTPKKQKAAAKPPQAESKEIQAIFDSIPTVRPPSPPAEAKKFNFMAANQRAHASAAGEPAELPIGAENCLAGLSFVFTGVLDSLGRDEGQALVKRYGGKVTGAPSSKTSYVVLGSDAGPKKLETIRKHNLKTINEYGLFELIRKMPANGGDGKAAVQYEAKKKAEEQKIKVMAAEIDREEKKSSASAAATSVARSTKAPQKSIPAAAKEAAVDDRLWTVKYAPTSLNMICGNKTAVEKLQSWLRNWRNNAKVDFKKPGKDGSGTYRAVMIHGPPGIGKTTAAHLVAKLENYDVVETNASDTRSKRLLEDGLRGVLDTTSLQGYFSGEGKKVQSEKKNLVLIMDEVDGMSAGDRGGVGALAAVAKKTRIPMILICNERRLPKMRPFDHVTYELPFRRPTADQIRSRLATICFREGLKIPPQVLDGLIEGTHSDIRQIVNMLSTVKLDSQNLDFDEGKQMSKAWEKHVILKPWDIVGKILSAQMFSQSSTATLNDKIELYFNDHEFSYLMLQENYLKTNPIAAGSYNGRERKFKLLELADNAAQSISDGDLVDRMIHGSQQQWSLMPTHAVFSFVRPASFVSGNMVDRVGFTSWLGNNSKQGKMARQIKEIQGHMRLRASGDRHEIRQQYLPALWEKLVHRLDVDGKDAVQEVIDLMDSYFLTREDWDSILELGLGPMSEKTVNIESQTKATFTRLYNQQSHPLPFMKASTVVAPKRLPKIKPDLEDAIDESDEGEEILGEEEVKEDDDELDLKKDKYVRAPKKTGAKKATAGKGTAKPKQNRNKRKKSDSDLDISDSEEDSKPSKARKGKKTKGKA